MRYPLLILVILAGGIFTLVRLKRAKIPSAWAPVM